MPTPILRARSAEFSRSAELVSEQDRLLEMRKACLLLPKVQQDMVAYLFHFLHEVAARCDVNKMTAKNLVRLESTSTWYTCVKYVYTNDGWSLWAIL
jgi:hypothetical protein